MAPIIILVLSQIADVLLTHYALVSGLAQEINPLGYTGQVVVVKTLSTALVALTMTRYRSRLRWLIWLPGLVMYAVVIWNVINIIVR